MLNKKQQEDFEKMVELGVAQKELDNIAGQPEPILYEVDNPEDEPPFQDKPKLDLGAIFKPESNDKVKETARILKCALDTQDYLGWLKGKTLEAKLESKFFEVGFYQGLYEKFVLENTP